MSMYTAARGTVSADGRYLLTYGTPHLPRPLRALARRLPALRPAPYFRIRERPGPLRATWRPRASPDFFALAPTGPRLAALTRGEVILYGW